MSTRGTRKTDPRLQRTGDQWLSLPNRWGIPVDVCAGPGVPLPRTFISGP
jgi:tRNA-splicing ligase RtcB